MWGLWPYGGAWLTRQLFERYLFGGDVSYLVHDVWPLLKGSAEFMLEYLTVDPRYPSWLLSGPTLSPENTFNVTAAEGGPRGKQGEHFLSMGTTIDHEVVRDLFGNAIRTVGILLDEGRSDEGITGKDTPAELRTLRSRMEQTLAKLPPRQQSRRYGMLQEWLEDYGEVQPDMRHMSPLYGLFPAALYDPIVNATESSWAQALIEHRLKYMEHSECPHENELCTNLRMRYLTCVSVTTVALGTTPCCSWDLWTSPDPADPTDIHYIEGWSDAWMVALWSRLQRGHRAYSQLVTWLLDVGKNLLDHIQDPEWPDAMSVFQIDGNFGAAAAMAEMLLQSHHVPDRQTIQLLPAVPLHSANATSHSSLPWDHGSFDGLRARGGYTVGVDWSAGRVTMSRISRTNAVKFSPGDAHTDEFQINLPPSSPPPLSVSVVLTSLDVTARTTTPVTCFDWHKAETPHMLRFASGCIAVGPQRQYQIRFEY
jgi:alpha-L-fucosidase 2